MNTKAAWIKDLEKREQELVLLRKEQIVREGEVYQREQKLKINQDLLKADLEALEKQKKLNQDCLAAMLAETEALGMAKGRTEERTRSEGLQKQLDAQRDADINLLKDLLGKAIAALQVNVKVERN